MEETFTIEIEPNYLQTGAYLGSRILEARPENYSIAAWRATVVSFAEHFRYLAWTAESTPEGETSDYDMLMAHMDTYLPR